MPLPDPAEGRLVYSTGQGRIRPQHDDGESEPGGDGIVRVAVERKGRRGKTVTVIAGAPLGKSALKSLAKELRRACGSGGTAKQGTIEVQGDHAAALVPLLEARGLTVKRVG